MSELQIATAELLPARLRSEDERHPRRRLDAAFEGRQAGLQRLLPAVFVRQFHHRQRTLCGESPQRCADRARLRARLRRADGRRRGSQRDEAACGRQFCRVRRRRRGPVRSDVSQDCRVRPHHRSRCARASLSARPYARGDAHHQSRQPHRCRRRDPQDHRAWRTLFTGDLGASVRVPRGGRLPDAGRHLRPARQRAQGHRDII